VTPAAIETLRCPTCAAPLRLAVASANGEIETGMLACGSEHCFEVRQGIPRFVPPDSYADSFGFQWKTFARLQLDSYNGTDFSFARFRAITGWSAEDLKGRKVLDAGCGAGRFAEVVAHRLGADLYAFDLSAATEACRENLMPHPPFVCQASIYTPPFAEGTFDFVYSIGVIQHTPDPHAAIVSLCRLVKPGGSIALWIYEQDWKSFVGTLGFKRLLRPLVSRLERRKQLAFSRALAALFFPVVWPLRRLGTAGKLVMRLLPVASGHLVGIPLSKEDFRTWVLLDTFDMYASTYDQPQTFQAVADTLRNAGFQDIERRPHGGVAVTARRKA
jgi:SAM-dependent methyltransferase